MQLSAMRARPEWREALCITRVLSFTQQPVEAPPFSRCGCCVQFGLELRQECPVYRTSDAPLTCPFGFSAARRAVLKLLLVLLPRR